MDTNTLYYTFSTIPQILAAAIAILAAFMHFRLISIKDLLIGDGKSAQDRLGQKGYILNDKYSDRLRDGINRKSIGEVKEVLNKLAKTEKEENYTKNNRPTGLQYLYEDRFCRTERHYNFLRISSLITFGVVSFTLIISLICLSQVDCLIQMDNYIFWTNLNIGLFCLSIGLIFFLVIISSLQNTTYENIKKRDKIIKRNKKINKP